MASERSKRRDFLSLSFITKSISTKLLIESCEVFDKQERKSQTKVFSTPPHLIIQLHKNNAKKLWSIRTSAAQIPIKSQHFVLRNKIYQRTIWATNSSSKDGQLMLYWQDSIAFVTEIKHDSLYFDTAYYTCTISVARDSAPVISNNLKTYHNKDLVKKSWDSSPSADPMTEMPTSGDLKSGDCLFLVTPGISTTPPKNWPSPQWEWLRTLYDVLHDVHTIKIRMLEIIFVNDKNAPETVLRIRKLQVLS